MQCALTVPSTVSVRRSCSLDARWCIVIGRVVIIAKAGEVVNFVARFEQFAVEQEVGAGKAGLLCAEGKDRFIDNADADCALHRLPIALQTDVERGGVAGAIVLGIGLHVDLRRGGVDQHISGGHVTISPLARESHRR